MITARMAAFTALAKVDSGGYSTLSLDSVLRSAKLDRRDSALASSLFYGVLENAELLDYIISQYSSKPAAKLEKKVRTVLRMGVYQLTFMEKIPDSAAVNESVALSKKTGISRASGLINAVLRSYIRAGKKYTLPDSSDYAEYMSVKYSCPRFIVELWESAYGRDICSGLLNALHGQAPIYVRANTTRIKPQALVAGLNESGVKAYELTWLPGAIELGGVGAIEELPAHREGLMHVQDAASQLCCKLLDPQPGDVIYDVCAAPGGKSFTLTELMNDNGRVIACDIHPHRVGLIKQGAQRLGLRSVEAVVRDASADDNRQVGADRVLCDVPCSGLGVIRRKPDIKFKAQSDIESLPALQRKILESSTQLLCPGGVLVYSTCTLSPSENAEIIDAFLKEHSEFEPYELELPREIKRLIDEPAYMITVFPQTAGTDGFFIARIRRRKG